MHSLPGYHSSELAKRKCILTFRSLHMEGRTIAYTILQRNGVATQRCKFLPNLQKATLLAPSLLTDHRDYSWYKVGIHSQVCWSAPDESHMTAVLRGLLLYPSAPHLHRNDNSNSSSTVKASLRGQGY